MGKIPNENLLQPGEDVRIEVHQGTREDSPDFVEEERFTYRKRYGFLARYLISGVGFGFLVVVLSVNANRLVLDWWILFLVGFWAVSLVLESMLRHRAPCAFRVVNDRIEIEGKKESYTLRSGSVVVNRILTGLLFIPGAVFSADGKLFLVFPDLDNYDGFRSALGIH